MGQPKDKEEEERGRYGCLTKKQVEVLKLRRKGLTHEEIAKILNTTRENVVILEKRALKNLKLARETLEYAAALTGALIRVPKGTRVVDLPRIIVDKADQAGIKLKMSFSILFDEVSIKSREYTDKGVLKRDLDIYLLPDGNLVILPAKEG